MKALLCRRHGTPDVLELGDLPEPELGAGQVLIDVAHAGVAFVDLLMVADRHQNKHPVPFAPGMEVAGTIRQLGPGVDDGRLRVGQRVAALVYDGAWAEQAVAPAHEVFPLPDALDTAIAAGMLASYLTSHLALSDAGRLRDGELLVVAGAAGGVGSAAIDLGRRVDAQVLGIASTEEKRRYVEGYGAVALDSDPETLRDRILEACAPRAVDKVSAGSDVVFDPVAGPLHQPLFRSLGWGGRYLIVGFAGGEIPKFAANHLLVKQRSAIGFVLMTYRRYRPELLQQAAGELFEWTVAGTIQPHVAAPAPLSEGAELLRQIEERKAVGRLVLAI